MNRPFSKFCFVLICLLSFVHIQKAIATDLIKSHSHEITYVVSSEDLYFNDDELMVSVGGFFYPVLVLQKSGKGWIARCASAGYCPQGHQLCGGCLLCHQSRCIYYIRPCKLWN